MLPVRARHIPNILSVARIFLVFPVVQALLGKGAALGTALAFMMAVIGLSLPEAVILRKVLKMPLIFIFFGVVAVGILIVGFLFNLVMPYMGV